MSIKGTHRPIICGHPDRKHLAKGMCRSCWHKDRYKGEERLKLLRKIKAAYDSGKYAESTLKCRLRLYSITPQEFKETLHNQDNKCAVCGNPETGKRYGKTPSLSVDHNHDTGKVRGLLCQDCNRMIGIAKENTKTLRAAALYLEISKAFGG